MKELMADKLRSDVKANLLAQRVSQLEVIGQEGRWTGTALTVCWLVSTRELPF
jgi:hypothetical protein